MMLLTLSVPNSSLFIPNYIPPPPPHDKYKRSVGSVKANGWALKCVLCMLLTLLICASCENPWMTEILGLKTITFDSNGGSDVPSQTLAKGQTVKRPQNPSKSEYTFEAWYTDNETFVEQWDFRAIPNSDITLYAKWNAYEYTVTFNANGATGVVPAAQTVRAGSSVTLPDQGSLARTGYTFDGWNTQSDGSGTNYAANSSYTPTASVTLYANWNHVHQWGEWTVITHATETTDGVEAIVCTICGEVKETRRGEYATGTSGLDFALISNNAYRVSRGTAEGDIVIPAQHRPDANSPYLPVTEIGNGANNSSINAFGGTLSEPNTTVTSVTFAADSRLTTIADFAFVNCTNLKSITIPAGVTSIGGSAFQLCTNLTSITIPASVTSISESAFGLSGLTSVTFAVGSQLTSIGNSVFRNTGLTSITIPANVTFIGNQAFQGCTNLKNITIDNAVYETDYGNNWGTVFPADDLSVTFRKNVGESAFYDCLRLTSVTIAAGVESIGNTAFQNCRFTNITLPSSLKSIGNSAFTYCSNLTDINIPAGVTSIGTGAFYQCNILRNITIDNDVYPTIVGGNNWGAIFTANDLSVTFRKNVGEWAFWGCSRLKSVTIAAGVTSIGDSAFESCVGLTSVTIAAGVTSIGDGAFLYCGLTSITIPAGVTTIGDSAFDSCDSLTSVTFAGTIANGSFGYNAFGNGDLPAKHSSGGPGTYTRASGSSTTWTKQ